MVYQRRRGGNLGLLLLGTQIMNFGLQNIPPVTLGLLASQIAIFLGVFPKYFPSPNAVCMSSYLVLEHRDWKRMILANFFHAHDMHLYFNMVSLLYKGSMLERKFGNVYFAYLVALFTGLTSLTYVGLGFVLDSVLSDQSYYLSCAVGFSGVLFALKVVVTEYSPRGMQYALGFIPVPSKYIFWAELVLIQLVTPNASFVGHLAGILVGLMYTKGPLKPLMDSFMEPGGAMDFTQPNRSGHRGQSSFFPFGNRLFGRGNGQNFHQPGGYPPHRPTAGPFTGSGRPAPSAPSEGWGDDPPRGYNNVGSMGYNHYTGGLSEDQQYQRAMEESMRQSQASSSSHSTHSGSGGSRPTDSNQRLYPDLDDLRNRRSNFYH